MLITGQELGNEQHFTRIVRAILGIYVQDGLYEFISAMFVPYNERLNFALFTIWMQCSSKTIRNYYLKKNESNFCYVEYEICPHRV